jgi:exodeoxyribonuclease V gamma subunit
VLISHPLQPFDPRTVTPGALGRPGPFTFDPAALRGAVASVAPRHPAPVFLPTPLPPPARQDLDLGDLAALLTNPVKGFLRQRLDVGVRFEEDDPSDSLPVELNALEKWGVGSRLLRDGLAGVSEADCRQSEWRRGVLPPGPLGSRALDEVLQDVRPLVEKTAALRAKPRRTVDVTVGLTDGRQLRGTVSGIHETVQVAVSYSKLGPAARLRAWINLLALTASDAETLWGAATVGRGEAGHPACATLTPLPRDKAVEHLEQLVELFDKGLREPLPMPVKTAHEYAAARYRDADVSEARRRAKMKWISGNYPGEDDDQAHQQVWGHRAPFETLLVPVHPDESWGGEPDRFAELAVRLWFPLLEHEQRAVL